MSSDPRLTDPSGSFHLERESLIASGLESESQITEYSNKLEDLHRQFLKEVGRTADLIAWSQLQFAWLWDRKPRRYQPNGNYLLSHVVDAQMSGDSETVGNCLGLTLLYNCLLRKMGIHAGAVYLEEAFGVAPHVLTVIPKKRSLIDVENILPNGYDYKGHMKDPTRTSLGDRGLVAEIYNSLGNDLFLKGDLEKAMECYDKALGIFGQHERAGLNKLILLDKMKSQKS